MLGYIRHTSDICMLGYIRHMSDICPTYACTYTYINAWAYLEGSYI